MIGRVWLLTIFIALAASAYLVVKLAAAQLATNTPIPDIVITGTCSQYRVVTFSITNNGGDMTSCSTFQVLKDNTTLGSNQFLLKAGQSTTLNVKGVLGTLVMKITSGAGEGVTGEATCLEPSQ